MEKVKHVHIGAYGIITRDNNIALIRKARGGYKGKLDLPGGGIEHTETPLEALYREIKEEVDGTVIEAKLLNAISTNITWEMEKDLYEDLHHIGILYLTNISEDKLKEEPDGIDSEGASWYDINDLKDEELSPFAKYAVKYLKEK